MNIPRDKETNLTIMELAICLTSSNMIKKCIDYCTKNFLYEDKYLTSELVLKLIGPQIKDIEDNLLLYESDINLEYVMNTDINKLNDKFIITRELVNDLINRIRKVFKIRLLNKKVEIVGSVYKIPNTEGDFGWMIKQDEYKDALFLFNDSEELYKSNSITPSGGNALIRPYKAYKVGDKIKPRAWGIPVGNISGIGYQNLSPKIKAVIDISIKSIRDIVTYNSYNKIIYPSNSFGNLATGSFNTKKVVKDYIMESLHSSFQ